MKEDIKVSQVHTTCRHCVFAQFDETGKTQTGCKLGKIDDYKNAGVEVLEVFDDKDVEFYLINGRFCMFYRNLEVMGKYPRDTWESLVHLQTKVPYQAMVFVEEDTTFQSLKKILRQLHEQAIKPNLVTVVNKQYPFYVREQTDKKDDAPTKYLKPSVLLDLLKNFEFHKFSLKNVYDEDLSDRDLIDLVFDNTKSSLYPFYVVFRAGFDVPENFSKEFNDAILIKMMQVGFVKPVDDLSGMIVNRVAHKKHGGNSFGVHLESKIEQFEEDAEKFMCEVKDICPSLS